MNSIKAFVIILLLIVASVASFPLLPEDLEGVLDQVQKTVQSSSHLATQFSNKQGNQASDFSVSFDSTEGSKPCFGQPPSSQFNCQQGIWTSNSSVTINKRSYLEVSTKISIKGNFDVFGDLGINLDHSKIEVTGNVTISGLVSISVSKDSIQRLHTSPRISIIRASRVTIVPEIKTVSIVKGKGVCQTFFAFMSGAHHPQQSPTVDVLVFVHYFDCHMWWIIFIVVISVFLFISLLVIFIRSYNCQNTTYRRTDLLSLESDNSSNYGSLLD